MHALQSPSWRDNCVHSRELIQGLANAIDCAWNKTNLTPKRTTNKEIQCPQRRTLHSGTHTHTLFKEKRERWFAWRVSNQANELLMHIWCQGPGLLLMSDPGPFCGLHLSNLEVVVAPIARDAIPSILFPINPKLIQSEIRYSKYWS